MFVRAFATLSILLAVAISTSKSAAALVPVGEKHLTVFAAASLKNALDEINAAFTRATAIRILASYAASSALMKQIEQAAHADVFFSADREWVDYGVRKQLIKDAARVDLLGNRLVLIAPRDSPLAEVSIGSGFDLVALAGDGRIVTGDVRAVPVGRYAKAALEKLGAWRTVEPKLAMAENVRAALTLVARGEAPLGIVYETDAKVEPKVKILAVFPADSHPPIVYPVAAIATHQPHTAAYLDFLQGLQAKEIFERHGFSFLVRPIVCMSAPRPGAPGLEGGCYRLGDNRPTSAPGASQ